MPHEETGRVIDVTLLVDQTIPDELLEESAQPPQRRPHSLLVAGIVAAMLGVLVSSAPAGPGTPGNARKVAIEGTLAGLGANAMYSVTPGGTLNAYKIPTGRRTWSHKLPSRTSIFYGEYRNTVLILTIEQQASLIALDAKTGAERWRHPGLPTMVSPQRSIAFYDPTRSTVNPFSPDTGTEAGPQSPLGSAGLIAVSLDSGQVTREYPDPGDGTHDLVFASGIDNNTFTNVGFLSRHFRDGAKFLDLANQEFRAFPGAPDYTWVTVVNELLIAGDGTTMVGYDRRTLSKRWSAADPGIEDPFGANCGRWVCLSSYGRNTGGSSPAPGIVAIDRSTGTTKWKTSSRLTVGGSGEYIPALPPDLNSSTGPAILSSKNGATLNTLTGWKVLDMKPTARRLALIRPIAGRGFRLGFIDLTQPKRVRIVEAAIPFKTCECNNTFIACRLDSDDTYGLWRYA